MKKILTLASVLLFVAIAFAASPTAPTLYGPVKAECIYSWNVRTASAPSIPGVYTPTALKDSMVGADTIILLNKFKVDPGWDYVIQMSDSNGAADSFYIEQSVYGSDNSTIVNVTKIDSTGPSSRYKAVQLTVNSTLYGPSITLKAIKTVATLKAVITRFEVWKRRASSNKLFD